MQRGRQHERLEKKKKIRKRRHTALEEAKGHASKYVRRILVSSSAILQLLHFIATYMRTVTYIYIKSMSVKTANELYSRLTDD